MVEMLLTTTVTQYGFGMLGGNKVGLNGATVVVDNIVLRQPDFLKHGVELVGRPLVTVVSRGLLGLAVSSEINPNTAMGFWRRRPFADAIGTRSRGSREERRSLPRRLGQLRRNANEWCRNRLARPTKW